MTDLDDPKLVVKDLLATAWDASNTPLADDPDIHTGWRDEDLGAPTVTASTDEESPTSSTGFTGIKGTGGRPNAETRGTVQVDVWVEPALVDGNAKQAADAIASEAKRIVAEHWNVRTYDAFSIGSLTAENYRYLSWLGREFLPESPDTAGGEPTFRYMCTIGYEYLDR